MIRIAALLALLLAVSGCADLTPCESAASCVIACSCPNGADGFGSGYRCTAGYCRDGHVDDRDCVRICENVVPSVGGDDDDSGDDDSGSAR